VQIKSLKLSNAFQHSELEIPFAPFQAIVGQNGSGKSNIIESIGYLFTNKFTLPGTIDSMVKEGEEDGSISATITHEGEEINLSTKLGKSSRSLKSAKLKLGKAAEVMEYLQNVVLRAPADIVNSSTIIRQGELTAGLFDSQAKRTETFMRMAGLADIEKKRQILADVRASVTVPMLSFSVAEAEKKVQELQDYMNKVGEERGQLPVFDADVIKKAQELITNVDQAESMKESLGKLTKEHADAVSMVSGATVMVSTRKIVIADLEKDEEKQREAAIKANAKLQHLAKAQQDWDAKQACEKQISSAQTSYETLKEVPATYSGEEPLELHDIVMELQTRISGLKETIDAFSQEVSVCPTCRRGCTKDEAHKILFDATNELAELMRLKVDASNAWTLANKNKENWETELSAYKTELQRILTQIQTAEEKLAMVKEAAQPESRDEAKALADAYHLTANRLKSARADLPKHEQILKDATALVNDLAVKLAQAGSLAESVTKDNPLYLGAKATLEEYGLATKKLVELRTIIVETEKRLTDEQARLDKLKADMEKSRTLITFTDHLEFARTAMHRDSFPSGRVKAFVDRMLINANVYLDAMNTGFSMSYDNEAGFIAFFPADQKRMRADRLSGGERVTFALAFRFAVNELHTDTGFLILDEPTVWLDNEHIDYVINALALVKSKIVPRVQLIIVTHDEKMAAVADSVFEVKKG
jgi:DNA repair exonuclease SbcCD ATPase subunit